jgi:hypothetical protein
MGERIALTGEMDHEAIQVNLVPDRYLMGKLSMEERLRFEEHFVDCSICLQQLESLEGLIVGLRDLAPPGIPAARPRRPGLVRRLREHPAAALLAAACFAVAVLSPAFFFGELNRTKGELESARRKSDEARRETAALARALERSGKAGASVGPLAASVFTLNLTRGASTGEPDNRIVVRDSREWVILLIDRPGPPEFESYRVRIGTTDRRSLGDPLAASVASGDMLAIGLPPGLLSAGDYLLTLEGYGNGPGRDLATYRFRAVPGK